MLALISGKNLPEATRSLQDSLDGRTRYRKPPTIVVNHPFDLVEQRISTVSRFRPALSVTPATSDYGDRISAQIVTAWFLYQAYVLDLDAFFQAMARLCYVTGESWIYPEWDENRGDLMPEWKSEQEEAKKEGRKIGVPYLDEHGNPALEEDGVTPKLINSPIKQGDLKLTLLSMFDVFPVRKGPDYKEWKEFFRIKWVDMDELKRDKPEFANQITNTTAPIGRFDPATLQEEKGYNQVMVVVYEHMPTPFVPEGIVLEFIDDVILERKPYYSHGLQPYVRMTDIDNPGDLFGVPFLRNIRAISQTINDITSMARRNFLLMAHPKWAVPQNAVLKKEQLGNDSGIVEYRGAQAPEIINAPVIPPDYFQFRGDLKSEMAQLAGINDVTRGNIPKRVDSGIALQYLDEQTNERANGAVLKYQTAQRDTFRLMLGIASQHYTKNDGRLLPILGNSHKYEIMEFDPTHLNKPLHVRFAASSALPQSRAIRTQSIIDLKKNFPNMLTDRQVMDILEFGEEEKFYDKATVAERAAESKIQDLLLGKQLPEPAIWEDLLVQHDTIVREMQTRDFNTNVPEDIKAGVVSYLQQIEFVMFERALTNPVFAQQCGQLADFPLTFTPSQEQAAAIGRQQGPAVAPPNVNPQNPAGAAASEPSAGAPGGPNIPPPGQLAPTPNTVPGPSLPPVQQPPRGS